MRPSSTGSNWQVTPLAGSVPAGKHYLIQEAAGTGGTVAYGPSTLDAASTIGAVSGGVGKTQVSIGVLSTVISGRAANGWGSAAATVAVGSPPTGASPGIAGSRFVKPTMC